MKLYLLRHAKSDWSDPTLTDHERPLNRRGKRARMLIAHHVEGRPVDLVICSTARRARSTARPVVEALSCPVRYDDEVYAADADALLDIVRGLPDSIVNAMLVGHNPSLEELTELLCGSSPAYPTAALGTIEFAVGRWADVEPGCGTLRAHITPRDLEVTD